MTQFIAVKAQVRTSHRQRIQWNRFRMYRRTLNNKSSIPNKSYQLQDNTDPVNNNYTYAVMNNKVKNYNSTDFTKKYNNNNNVYYNNSDSITMNTENYYQYAYPYGNSTNNKNGSPTETTQTYNYYYPIKNIQNTNDNAYYSNNKNYTHQNYKYNKNNKNTNGNKYHHHLNNNNNNFYNQKRRDSISNTSNINYLKPNLRYFNDPIDIKTLKEMNNNKPYISAKTSSHRNNFNNSNNSNTNSNNKYRRNSHLKETLHVVEEKTSQINHEQHEMEQDSIYKLISKNHNIKRRTNKPILYVAGLDTLPIYSFDEMINNKELKLTESNKEEEDDNDQAGNEDNKITIDLKIKDMKQFFQQLLKSNNPSNTTSHTSKKPIRHLVQAKHSLQFNKSFQQYNNDSFDLSFDGKAMDRSDIFRMVDSFSVAFDNDKDPNSTNPNISINNGSNTNGKTFTLSKNILPEEMTNNLVY